MKTDIRTIALSLCLAAAIFGLTACGSTRTENGVTIEKKSSSSPMNWF